MSALRQALEKHYQLKRAVEGCDWWTYAVVTPRHRFTNVIRLITATDGELCVCTTVRDEFSQLELEALLAFLDEHLEVVSVSIGLRLLEGFRGPQPHFDAVALLGPTYHSQYEAEEPRLHSRTIVALPIARFELSGAETADELRQLRRDFVSTIDWSRAPSPKILVAPAKKTSQAVKLLPARREALLQELDRLARMPGGRMTIENFRRERCVVTSDGNGSVSILSEEQSWPKREIGEREAAEWILSWLAGAVSRRSVDAPSGLDGPTKPS